MSSGAAALAAKVRMKVRGQRVTISAPREVLYDIKKLQRVQEVVLGKLGHTGCYSGFDIRWRQFEDFGV
jgi:hypothetical protein